MVYPAQVKWPFACIQVHHKQPDYFTVLSCKAKMHTNAALWFFPMRAESSAKEGVYSFRGSGPSPYSQQQWAAPLSPAMFSHPQDTCGSCLLFCFEGEPRGNTSRLMLSGHCEQTPSMILNQVLWKPRNNHKKSYLLYLLPADDLLLEKEYCSKMNSIQSHGKKCKYIQY